MSIESFFQKKNVLVAGGSGFVGTNLTKKLIQLGANVRSTFYSKEPKIKFDSVEYFRSDFLNAEDCYKATSGMDYVFMCAANSSGASVMQNTPLVHLTPNVIMNTQILASAYENSVKKFCFISSNTVYPLTDFPVTENDARYEFYEKYFIVGWMKQFSEIMCQMYSNYLKIPMTTLVVRPGNLYGPFDKFNKNESKVVAALIRRAIEGENPFVVWGDGYDVKDFLYIDDFIEGLLLAFKNPSDLSPINIASGQPVTIRELLDVILNITDQQNLNINYDTLKPTMIPKRLISIEKIKTITGWKPTTLLHSGIEETVNWYQSYYKDSTPEELEL